MNRTVSEFVRLSDRLPVLNSAVSTRSIFVTVGVTVSIFAVPVVSVASETNPPPALPTMSTTSIPSVASAVRVSMPPSASLVPVTVTS